MCAFRALSLAVAVGALRRPVALCVIAAVDLPRRIRGAHLLPVSGHVRVIAEDLKPRDRVAEARPVRQPARDAWR